MGILQAKLDNKIEELKDNKILAKKIKSSGNTADDILLDDSEVTRLSKYVSDKQLNKIINKDTALKHGVKKIGTKGDTFGILGFNPGQLLYGASIKAKKTAAKVFMKLFAKNNLIDKIITKSGKEVLGKSVSKNVYIKSVSYMRKGKQIFYLQARNKLTGRVVSMKKAARLMAKSS